MGRKHWEKEKLLITSNFSLSLSVFKRLFSQGHQKVSLSGNGLNQSNLKALADDKINVTENLKFVMGRVENMEGNGENIGYQCFLLFQQCIQKASFSRSLKVGIMR